MQHLDPRDAPGTDDHTRLMHPHGAAIAALSSYTEADLADYVLASVAAHTQLSADYLALCAHLRVQPLPLCRGAHVERIVDVRDLPHGARHVAMSAMARGQGVLRAWRHLGLDCEEAEARTACEHMEHTL